MLYVQSWQNKSLLRNSMENNILHTNSKAQVIQMMSNYVHNWNKCTERKFLRNSHFDTKGH